MTPLPETLRGQYGTLLPKIYNYWKIFSISGINTAISTLKTPLDTIGKYDLFNTSKVGLIFAPVVAN